MINSSKLLTGAPLNIVLALISLLIYLFDSNTLGIFTVLLSIFFIMKTESFLVFLLSFYNIMIGIAFDYYLRVRPYAFDFYFGNGASVEYLCLLSILIYLAINCLERQKKVWSSTVIIRARKPEFSRLIYYPFLLAIIGCSLFILKNERTILSSTFNIRELVKYPFLEYFGIIVLFAIGSARDSKAKEIFAYAASTFLILVCLLTSYRMVAIVIGLSLIFSRYCGVAVKKSLLLSFGAFFYSALMVISYIRLGASDIGISHIFGYVDNGRLDNTFSGVIETALIYTAVSQTQSFSQNIMHLIGTIAPLPSSFMPDSTSYLVNLFEIHRGKIPGGGLLAGFFIYFNYLLAIPVFAFLFFALRYSTRKVIFGAMYFICFICVSRWWLYGPFVFFKFFGIFFLLYLINIISLTYEKRIKFIKTRQIQLHKF